MPDAAGPSIAMVMRGAHALLRSASLLVAVRAAPSQACLSRPDGAPERGELALGQRRASCPVRERPEQDVADARAHQRAHGMPDGGAHEAHLALASFVDHESQPRVAFARLEAVAEAGDLDFAPGRACARLSITTVREAPRGVGLGEAIDERMVLLLDLVARMREAMREFAVVREDAAGPRYRGRAVRRERRAAAARRGSSSMTVRRPCGSRAVVTNPAGLFIAR